MTTFKAGEISYDRSIALNQLRLDIFDGYEMSKGATIDIAYMGFFDDANHAMANYELAIEKYNFDKANWVVNVDAFVVDGTEYNNQPANANGLGPVKKIGGLLSYISVDMKDYSVKTLNNSLIFNGWVVTPFGAMISPSFASNTMSFTSAVWTLTLKSFSPQSKTGMPLSIFTVLVMVETLSATSTVKV